MMQIMGNLLYMVLWGSMILLIVLAIRPLLKKKSNRIMCVLWLVVMFRFLCPLAVKIPMPWLNNFAATNETDSIVSKTSREKEYNTQAARDDHSRDVIGSSKQMSNVDLLGEMNTANPADPENLKNQMSTVNSIDSVESIESAYSVVPMETMNAVESAEMTKRISHISTADIIRILGFIWLSGTIIILLAGIRKYLLIKRSLREAIYINEWENYPVKISDVAGVPLAFGIWKREIYVPVSFEEAKNEETKDGEDDTFTRRQKELILWHETMHLKRLDPLRKVLAFIMVAVHWWNPLVWISVKLMDRDIEMACDEAVLEQVGQKERKEYARTLLCFAAKQGGLTLITSFGESDAKSRVRNALEFRKSSTWMKALTMLPVLILGGCLALNPTASASDEQQSLEDKQESLEDKQESLENKQESLEAGQEETEDIVETQTDNGILDNSIELSEIAEERNDTLEKTSEDPLPEKEDYKYVESVENLYQEYYNVIKNPYAYEWDGEYSDFDYEWDSFQLIDFDGDNSKELIITNRSLDRPDPGMQYYLIADWHDGKIVLSELADGVASAGGYRGTKYYVPGKGIIYDMSISAPYGNPGFSVYELSEGKFEYSAGGYLEPDPDYHIPGEYDKGTLYWEGKEVSVEEFKEFEAEYSDNYSGIALGDVDYLDIESMLEKLENKDTKIVEGSEATKEAKEPAQTHTFIEPYGKEISIDKTTREKMNLFLSNFSEAYLTDYDYDRDHMDMEKIYDWVHIWTKVNKGLPYERRKEADYTHSYEWVSLEDVNKVTEEYLGITTTDSMASSLESDYFFYENGKFYSPAADGDTYAGLSIVTKVEDLGNNKLKLYFNGYDFIYWDDEKLADYSQTDEEASKNSDYVYNNSGYAIVKKRGSSYILEHIEEMPNKADLH